MADRSKPVKSIDIPCEGCRKTITIELANPASVTCAHCGRQVRIDDAGLIKRMPKLVSPKIHNQTDASYGAGRKARGQSRADSNFDPEN